MITCEYCQTRNPEQAPRCLSCGASLVEPGKTVIPFGSFEWDFYPPDLSVIVPNTAFAKAIRDGNIGL